MLFKSQYFFKSWNRPNTPPQQKPFISRYENIERIHDIKNDRSIPNIIENLWNYWNMFEWE